MAARSNVDGSETTISTIDQGDSVGKERCESEGLVNELATDYAKYVRVDISKEKHVLEENVEDILARLDEYCGLVDMVRSDDALCYSHTLPEIYAKACDLENLFTKIDKLEAFVEVVRKNLDTMEEKVAEAEYHFGGSSVKKLFTSLQKPLFTKKNFSTSDQRTLTYEPPDIFTTNQYFNNPNAAAESGTESLTLNSPKNDNEMTVDEDS